MVTLTAGIRRAASGSREGVGRRTSDLSEKQVPDPRFARVRNDRKKNKTSSRKNTRRR
jgi:hypothetical protein